MDKTRGQKKPERREIGRVTLREGEDLILTLVDGEKLDIRVWMNTERYKGPTKRGVRFYLFDGIWEKTFELLKAFNDEYEKIA